MPASSSKLWLFWNCWKINEETGDKGKIKSYRLLNQIGEIKDEQDYKVDHIIRLSPKICVKSDTTLGTRLSHTCINMNCTKTNRGDAGYTKLSYSRFQTKKGLLQEFGITFCLAASRREPSPVWKLTAGSEWLCRIRTPEWFVASHWSSVTPNTKTKMRRKKRDKNVISQEKTSTH